MLPRLPIEGRLAAEPELRFSQAGNAVARLRLVASDRKHNDATGQWEDTDSLWIDVTAFGKLAENVCESVVKGDLVIVTGRLKTDEWQDKDSGQKRQKIVLIADAVGPSLAFRTTPHGASRQAPQRLANPVQQAYPQETDPPF
jgi:single-strand DNA-binding protein